MPKNPSIACRTLGDLVGQILDDRFAVLEATGPDRYQVYDIRALRSLEILIRPGGDGFVILGAKPPREGWTVGRSCLRPALVLLRRRTVTA